MSISIKKGVQIGLPALLVAALIFPPLAANADELAPEETPVSEEVVTEEVITEEVVETTEESTSEDTTQETTEEETSRTPSTLRVAPQSEVDEAFIGIVGELLPWSSATNEPSYWEDYGPHDDAVCYSHSGNSSHGSVTGGGKTVTLNAYGADWPGDHWELLVVKGGSVSNNVIVHPSAGVAYASPLNDGGQQSNVSHWIVCKGTTPDEPFDWNWTYPAPTCDGVTITFPANLPAGQQGVMEVNVTGGSISGMQYKLEGDAYTAKYPNGHAGLTVFIPWSDFRNYSIPATGEWTVTQLQVHGTNYHWQGTLECGEEPPTNQVCTTYEDGGTSTNLDAGGWVEFASKPGGSYKYVDGGLALTNVDGNSKVSWAHPISGGSLALLGQIAVDYTHGSGVLSSGPGLNVFVTFESGLTGTLVGEPNVYGQDWWLTDGSNAAIVGPQTGGGFGSNRHGTIDEWLALYPDATFAPYFAFAYGTGGPASGVLHSVTIGCTTYSFDHEEEVTEGVYPTVTVIPEYCDYETGGVIGGSITLDGGEGVKSSTVFDENMVEQTDTSDLPAGEYTVEVVFDDGFTAPTADGWTVDPNDPSKATTVVTILEAECEIVAPVVTSTDSVCVEGSASEVTVTVTATPGVTSEYRINDGPWLPYNGPFTASAGDDVDVRSTAPSQYTFPNGEGVTETSLTINDPGCEPEVEVVTPILPTFEYCPVRLDLPDGLTKVDGSENVYENATAFYEVNKENVTIYPKPGVEFAESDSYTIGDDGEIVVPFPSDKDCPKPEEPNLAVTGAEVGGLVAGALALLAVGGILVLARKRRQEA